MRLELASFPVKDIESGRTTGYSSGVLEVNKEELISLVLEDRRIVSASLDTAFPGEPTRIVNIRDVLEPRVKVSGPGCVFPGIMGPVRTAGEGRTHRLSGFTVIASAQYQPALKSGTGTQVGGLVDMWGPGSQVTPFGSTINLVLTMQLVDGVSELEAYTSIRLAECKVAQRLAETTRETSPEDTGVFELGQVDPSLPRMVYIMGLSASWHEPISSTLYYGLPIRESLPTFIHPNELLDGAVTSDARRGGGTRPVTWQFLNHPVVFGLLKEHGKHLNFLGIILQRTRFETEHGKHVTAEGASQMARLLKADGAIVTRTVTSGNNMIDTMLTVQACESKGVKTVLMTPERGGTDGTEMPLIFHVPEATAIVSAGSFERPIRLPVPKKVIGVEAGQMVTYQPQDEPYSPWGELDFDVLRITGGIDWWGGMHRTCKVA